MTSGTELIKDHSVLTLKEFDDSGDKCKAIAVSCMRLSISGPNDKSGYKAVRAGRLSVKDLRCNIENKRKQLKADSLAYGKAVDREAKRLTEIIEPVELYLEQQEVDYEKEQERIKAAAVQAKFERLSARIARIREVEGNADDIVGIEKMDDAVFENMLDGLSETYTARKLVQEQECRRIAMAEAEEKAAREEATRRQEQLLAEEQAMVAAEKARLAQQKAEQDEAMRQIQEQQAELLARAAEEMRQSDLALSKQRAAESRVAAAALEMQRQPERAKLDEWAKEVVSSSNSVLDSLGDVEWREFAEHELETAIGNVRTKLENLLSF